MAMNVQTLLPSTDRLPRSPHVGGGGNNQCSHDLNDPDDLAGLSEVTSHQEWSDFLSSSVLALSLDDPQDDDNDMSMLHRVKPQPISTSSSPAHMPRVRVGSPLVLAMSPLASLPSSQNTSTSSWATWQLSHPPPPPLDDISDNNATSTSGGQHSPLGVPLLRDGDTDMPHRMRAKSFSTLYSSEHHRHQMHGFRSPPLPHLQTAHPPPPPPDSSFSLRRYSGDFESSMTHHEMQPPPPRGIRSYSMGGYPSSSPSFYPTQQPQPHHPIHHPAAAAIDRGMGSFRTALPRQLQQPRQPHPPLPTRAASYEWTRSASPPSSSISGMPHDDFEFTKLNHPPLPPPSSILEPSAYYEVQFKRCRKDVFAGALGFQVGAYVKVEGDRGEDVGYIIRAVSDAKKATEMMTSASMVLANDGDNNSHHHQGVQPGTQCMKRIMRAASDSECDLLRQQHKEEQEVLQVCRTKVRQRMLPMNVIDAEYQFDRHKLTFFFEADRRIDFRELVRDLFAIYKTRIWLQQVVHKSTSSMALPPPPTSFGNQMGHE
ncbi:Aste57867_16483 [Aphanomyces stellatus]|uniref:Aste57867_16483 protein n=1 Tax=Aphanomyces stellatus TaxID=120398 RepID=A0A485L6D2_9STRA|nr:hypothetical protein As57867_016426 [Aphanomyces stellatus]VFT93257.1 Aste57867_16483 [Aphanomyces stellatus]